MSALVANLLQYSRGSSSQISTVDVREEVANTLELIYSRLRKYYPHSADYLPGHHSFRRTASRCARFF